MKRLRILTGIHAGAQIGLSQGAYAVSGSEDGDIHISDWKHDPIRLTVDEGNTVNAMVLNPDASAATPMIPFEDFVPRLFRDVALCIGPANVPWPSDLKLLERLLKPEPQGGETGKAGHRPFPRMIAFTVGASLALLGGFAGLVATVSSNAEARRPLPSLLGQVQRAIDASQVAGVTARGDADRVVVEGLVNSDADAARLRSALQPFPGDQVLRRVASAESTALAIDDALSNPGLAVRYRGNGVFVVSGDSVDPAKVRSSARRIAGDLGPLVGRIDVAVNELPAPSTVPVNALLSSQDVQYVQTRDGTKHLTVIAPYGASAPITSLR